MCWGLIVIIPLSQKNSMVQSASFWVQTSESDFNNGTFDNVTIEIKGSDTELKIDTIELDNWFNKIPKNGIQPSARSSHAMAPVWGTDQIVLFEGNNGSVNNETWIYDLRNNTWTDKTPSPRPGNYPSSGYRCMASIWGTNKVLIYGRLNFGDTWVYNVSNNTWINMNPSKKPPNRDYHAIASICGTDKILLFGGIGPSNEYDDTWIYNLSNNSWTNKNPLGNKPSARYWHSMASIDGTDNVVLFGGLDSSGNKNDTWVYDLSDNKWVQITSVNNPLARRNHALASIYGTKNVLLFGGYVRFNKYFDDTWIFTLNNNSKGNWTEITGIANKPSNRYEIAMAGIYGMNRVVLFGGRDTLGYKNDTWIFVLSQHLNNGYFISSSYDIGLNSSLKTLRWIGNTSINTSIEFQIRTAQKETDLSSKYFIGPDGSTTTYYTFSPSTIWTGHNGDRWVQYKAYLSTKNSKETPRLKNVTITYNYWPNTTLISPNNNSILNNNKPIFMWNFTDSDSMNQSAYQVLINDDITFESVDYESDVQSSTDYYWQFPNGTNYTSIADGVWYWKVQTRDNDGDWGHYSPPWKIRIETIAPNSIITAPDDGYYNILNTISGIASDSLNGTGLKKVELAINRISDDTYWTGQKWTDLESWLLTSGTTKWTYDTSSVIWYSGFKYNIQSRAIDNATNIGIPDAGKIITMDFDNVTFSNAFPIFSDVSSTENVKVGVTISDQISGVNASTIEYIISENMGKTWTSWEPVKGLKNGRIVNVTLNLTFLNGTGNRIKWRASDLAGNGPTESRNYIINVNTWVPLIKPKVNLIFPLNAMIINTTQIKFTWELEDTSMEGVLFDLYFDNITPPYIWETNLINTKYIMDNLMVGETYYWTVIPRTETNNGWCISGVWSFKVEIPIPKVTLISPENSSIISSPKPTLIWSVDYNGTEQLSYDVYLDTEKNFIDYEEISTTYYLPKTVLEKGKTYYWKVVPWAGAVRCPESETWSFTVNRDYRPRIELKLTVNPPYLEQVPGDVVSVQATVFNLGELTDTISLSVHVPADADIIALVNEPSTMDAISEGTAEFNITVTIAESAKKGEVVLTLVAVSGKAAEYDLVVEENAELTVKIFGIDKPETDRSSTLFTSLNILFIIIIIIIILALAIYVNKRRKCDKEKKSNKEAVTLKPGEFPTAVISVGQPPTVAQLPGSAAGNVGEQSNTLTSSIPVLASSPSTVQAPASQQIPQSPQLPQLPPAQSQATKFEAGETTSVPIITTTTSIPTPVVSASETVPKQQQVSAQEPRETDNAQPQEQDKEVSEHQNKNSEP